MRKVKWGVLSTANIGVKKVIPGMMSSQWCDISAICSRSEEKAQKVAQELGIPTYYGSYEELLNDPNIEAIYNPLPNHLHVPFTKKALEAGKHVLCEKPISTTEEEAKELLQFSEQFPELKVMEAFMYRFHPQWAEIKKQIAMGTIGEVKSVHSEFTYFNRKAENVRNIAAYGGGGLLDIGCYCINLSRFIFDEEPNRVAGSIDYDPDFNVDRIAHGLLDFSGGTATFLCATQLAPRQSAIISGTKGSIEIDIPFNAANEIERSITIKQNGESTIITFPECDQYALQGDAFAKAIVEQQPLPFTLHDALANMHVITKIITSEDSMV